MGINEGIIAVKQITDEWRWFQAMQQIEETFKDEGILKVLPRFTTEQFDGEQMQKFLLDEDQNYHKNGTGILDWYWSSFPYEWDIAKLKTEYGKLKEEYATFLEESKENPEAYWSEYERLDMKNLLKAINYMECCTQTKKDEIFQLTKKHGWCSSVRAAEEPPTLYEFTLGEHPTLPVFGRHFKNCTSKITRDGVSPLLQKIFRILKGYFPDHIAFWSECFEFAKEQLFESGVYKLDTNAIISKERFYKEVGKVFKDVSDSDKVHQARKTLVNVLRQ